MLIYLCFVIRSISIYFFMALYLLLNSGWRADIELCCDELDGISFFTDQYDCSCGMKHCGKVKHIELRQKTDQETAQLTQTSNLSGSKKASVFNHFTFIRTADIQLNHVHVNQSAHAPPDCVIQKFSISYQCFRC